MFDKNTNIDDNPHASSIRQIFKNNFRMKSGKDLIGRIKKIVIDKYPSAKIFLFGSRARGTTLADSDWDLLILLNKDLITPEIEKEVTNPLYDLEFETGEVISQMIYSEKEWNTRYSITPFYRNIMKEGKLL